MMRFLLVLTSHRPYLYRSNSEIPDIMIQPFTDSLTTLTLSHNTLYTKVPLSMDLLIIRLWAL